MGDRTGEFISACDAAVSDRDRDALRRVVMQACGEGVRPARLRECLLTALDRTRGHFMTSSLCLPEFLLTVDTVTSGLERISELDDSGGSSCMSLIIGVVEGDPHDLGKNVIAQVYRAYGYRVTDLGRGVAAGRFVDAVREHEAQVLALSAMMSTTTPLMGEVIAAVRGLPGTVTVMAGGAFVDEAMAARLGADGYAASAVAVIEKTREACRRVFGE